MAETNTIIIYCALILVGVFIGYLVSFRKYKRLTIEVLDYLKWNKELDNDKYDYYVEKFVTKKDSMKAITTFIRNQKNIKKGEKD